MSDSEASDFIRETVKADIASGKWDGAVVTRFPPEPNGYLHIGHAKAICLDFGVAAEFGGVCRLRFDDTNPVKEDTEYVEAIEADVRWLGWDWEGDPRYASDYFEQMYAWAEQLITAGKAYVDDQSLDEIRATRGSLTEPGTASPHRNRSVDENLDLFRRMRAGEFPNGSKVLRAKIDMASSNMNLRDPVMYRILHAAHHRTGDAWCIYPMYDWAHGLEDSIEGVTHSLCTLEFENHRPLYDWFLEQLDIHHPQQIEFARLNLDYTVMSKRRLLELVERKLVSGWDDPRMPTLCGLRRRGVPPEAIRSFLAEIGISKFESQHSWALFEHHIRKALNASSERTMAVLDPVKVVIENWDAERRFTAEVPRNPEDPDAGMREVPFGRELWIEREDFMAEPVKKFFRLGPDCEVRLRGIGFVRCTGFDQDADGTVTEIRCTIDEETLGGANPSDGRKVKATLHWISAADCVDAEIRCYDHLFTAADPTAVKGDGDWTEQLNPDSLTILSGCKVSPELADVRPPERWQFERLGYFCADPDSQPGKPVFNRTATLRDAWARLKSS